MGSHCQFLRLSVSVFLVLVSFPEARPTVLVNRSNDGRSGVETSDPVPLTNNSSENSEIEPRISPKNIAEISFNIGSSVNIKKATPAPTATTPLSQSFGFATEGWLLKKSIDQPPKVSKSSGRTPEKPDSATRRRWATVMRLSPAKDDRYRPRRRYKWRNDGPSSSSSSSSTLFSPASNFTRRKNSDSKISRISYYYGDQQPAYPRPGDDFFDNDNNDGGNYGQDNDNDYSYYRPWNQAGGSGGMDYEGSATATTTRRPSSAGKTKYYFERPNKNRYYESADGNAKDYYPDDNYEDDNGDGNADGADDGFSSSRPPSKIYFDMKNRPPSKYYVEDDHGGDYYYEAPEKHYSYHDKRPDFHYHQPETVWERPPKQVYGAFVDQSFYHPVVEYPDFGYYPPGQLFNWTEIFKIKMYTLMKIVTKILIFKMIVKFIAVICLLLFVPQMRDSNPNNSGSNSATNNNQSPRLSDIPVFSESYYTSEHLNQLTSTISTSIESYRRRAALVSNNTRENVPRNGKSVPSGKSWSWSGSLNTWHDYLRLFQSYLRQALRYSSSEPSSTKASGACL